MQVKIQKDWLALLIFNMNDVDIFIVKNSRNKEDFSNFLNSYLIDFVPISSYFEYPMSYSQETVFETTDYNEMLDYVLLNNLDYIFYFKSKEGVDSAKKVYIAYYNQSDIVVYAVMMFVANENDLKEEIKRISWFKNQQKYIRYFDYPPTLNEIENILNHPVSEFAQLFADENG